jgi:hypothetical protein
MACPSLSDISRGESGEREPFLKRSSPAIFEMEVIKNGG